MLTSPSPPTDWGIDLLVPLAHIQVEVLCFCAIALLNFGTQTAHPHSPNRTYSCSPLPSPPPLTLPPCCDPEKRVRERSVGSSDTSSVSKAREAAMATPPYSMAWRERCVRRSRGRCSMRGSSEAVLVSTPATTSAWARYLNREACMPEERTPHSVYSTFCADLKSNSAQKRIPENQKPRKPENQKTRKSKNQKTKKSKNQKTEKTKKTRKTKKLEKPENQKNQKNTATTSGRLFFSGSGGRRTASSPLCSPCQNLALETEDRGSRRVSLWG